MNALRMSVINKEATYLLTYDMFSQSVEFTLLCYCFDKHLTYALKLT